MNPSAVISCPRCLRQYEVDDSTAGKVGRCYGCKSQFVMGVTKLTVPVDDPVVLYTPVEPHTSFLKDGCITLAKNACLLLTMAEEPVTIAGVMMIAKTVARDSSQLMLDEWREGYCGKMLNRAYMICFRRTDPGYPEVFDYFATYLPSRSYHALDMLTNAFIGALDGVDWDSVEGVKQPVERKIGPLERWARKRGW
jgi:hypothetical protein